MLLFVYDLLIKSNQILLQQKDQHGH